MIMEIIERTIELNEDLINLFSPGDFFFDIESLGLSPKYSEVYLIGVMDKKEGPVKIRLFFANSRMEEEEILEHFYNYSKDFKKMITFNGENFDIPFISKRCENYNIPMDFSGLKSIDLYKKFKGYKNLFNLERCTQKSFETFLGIQREDKYDGGKLINVYYQYEDYRDRYLKNLLILHNFEDVEGMAYLNSLTTYSYIKDGDFKIDSITVKDNKATFIGTLNHRVPTPVSVEKDNFYVNVLGYQITGEITLIEDTLKLFHKNTGFYVYLPMEDMIVPKSLADNIPKERKEKATKENCYTPVFGIFYEMPKDNKIKSYFNTNDKVIYKFNYLHKSNYIKVLDKKESPDISELSEVITVMIRYCFS